jgi:uncharacterized damage-inducible protein DinB
MAENAPAGLDYPTVDTLFRHNLWANAQLFALCAGLTDAQLDASIVGAYGSIRATLAHIANAEYSYWHRITTGQPFRRPEGALAQSMTELQESIRLSGKGLIAAAPAVQADELVVVDWDGTPRSVPKAVILTQAINHATEHRAQIMATLTQLDIQPPDLDGWSYFDAQKFDTQN